MKYATYLKSLSWFSVTLLLIIVAGCAHRRPDVRDISQVGSKNVMVVGRIELTPPLDKKDQILHGIGTGGARNKAYVITSEKWKIKEGALGRGDVYFEATLGKPFYIKENDKPFYFLTEQIFTVLSDGAREYVNLPGGVKINIHHGDKAVYIGTLRFTRNEYFDITKAQIIDDYKHANAAFKKKFGVKYNMRKALAIPIQSKKSK